MKMLDFKVNGEDESYSATNSLTKIAMVHWLMPVPPIREYYGEDIGIYFEWMNYFLSSMFIPGVLGLLVWILNQSFFENPAKSPLNALFSIFMAFWGALFSIYWSVHQRSLKILWDNLLEAERGLEETREEFKGEPKMNPVTEKVEPHYSSSKRLCRYIESVFIIIPCFAVVFVFLVIFYNLTGIITVEEHGENVFLIPFIAELAAPDGLFDANSNMAYIPSILQVLITMTLNKYFREIAKFATDRENHKYQSNYE